MQGEGLKLNIWPEDKNTQKIFEKDTWTGDKFKKSSQKERQVEGR